MTLDARSRPGPAPGQHRRTPQRRPPDDREFRPDIEGLRAVAVLLVVRRRRREGKGCDRHGDPAGGTVVVLFGDSHTEQWFEAADRDGSHVTAAYVRLLTPLPAAALPS